MMKMMKKKLKRILKNEWVKKVIIILLAILVASITTSFCFGIKKAEGCDKAEGCGTEATPSVTPAPTAAAPTGIKTFERKKGKKDKKHKREKGREKFKCDVEEQIKGKTTEQAVEMLAILHKSEHKKRHKQDKKIDGLKDEVKSYKEQNRLLLTTIDTMNRRFTTMFSTQFGLLDPALTPERMEDVVKKLTAKKEELVSEISQRNSLLSAIAQEINLLTRKKRRTKRDDTQLGLYEIQKKQVEKEILEMRASYDEVVTQANLIDRRRSQVTGQQPTRPFGPETVQAPQGQTPETAANQPAQPAPQLVNNEDQIRALLVALLSRGNGNGRQPAIQPNGFFPPQPAGLPPAGLPPAGQRPPLSGRGQRGIRGE